MYEIFHKWFDPTISLMLSPTSANKRKEKIIISILLPVLMGISASVLSSRPQGLSFVITQSVLLWYPMACPLLIELICLYPKEHKYIIAIYYVEFMCMIGLVGFDWLVLVPSEISHYNSIAMIYVAEFIAVIATFLFAPSISVRKRIWIENRRKGKRA